MDAFQVINALYDGLTEIDVSDPENAQTVPLLAESFESNEDATVWTFTIKEGQQFADGEPILPSTFQRSWERIADLAGDYSYLLNFIEGGAERLAGEADTISGVVADDEAMTLDRHAVGAVLQLRGRRRIPDVLSDARRLQSRPATRTRTRR